MVMQILGKLVKRAVLNMHLKWINKMLKVKMKIQQIASTFYAMRNLNLQQNWLG